MDLDGIARKIAKLAIQRIRTPGPFFELMWREVFHAKKHGWIGDDRARLISRMIADNDRSASQLFQDVWVAFETGDKRSGYFVEFGATDGVSLSNTLMLERDLGWRGILAEPNPAWLDDLRRNRPQATIATECVWSRSGETLTFLATGAKELGTVSRFADTDRHARTREDNRTIAVPSISLNDLLARNRAPRDIDFMSIDTEGSEFEILQAFDFDRWNVRLLSIEHNFTDSERRIADLLGARGYDRRFPEFSRFDAWFRKR